MTRDIIMIFERLNRIVILIEVIQVIIILLNIQKLFLQNLIITSALRI